MASLFGSRNRHLDASSGREVVFCHACAHQWYKDEHEGLECPSCNSGATEIVEAATDPREDLGLPPVFNSITGNPWRPSDSDPEEDDTEDHFGSPFYERRPPRQGAAGQGDGDVILRRFADMLMNDFGAARPNRHGPESLFPSRPGEDLDSFGLFPASGTRTNGAPTIHRTTFRSGPVSGSATFTIISNNVTGDRNAQPAFPPGFPTLFSQIFNNASPPNVDDPDRAAGSGPGPGASGRPMPGLGLHELLASLLNPQAAVHGDAVYTQEALDRIITSLMEANPQSNAAPPASQAAIDLLEKKQVDEKMLGAEGKAECTICIDELKRGDEVTVLPCTHWFHGECVTLWLKEHNTCPICRAPIEQRDGQNNNSRSQSSQPQSPGQSSAFSMPASIFGQPRARPERFTRSPRENQDRLDAIRNLGNYRGADSSPGLPRRNSLSPVSSRHDGTSRPRARSPSSSRDQDAGVSPYDRGDYFGSRRYSSTPESRESRERGSQPTQSSGHGPLSWLRDHLGRGSGSNSDRDRRR